MCGIIKCRYNILFVLYNNKENLNIKKGYKKREKKNCKDIHSMKKIYFLIIVSDFMSHIMFFVIYLMNI